MKRILITCISVGAFLFILAFSNTGGQIEFTNAAHLSKDTIEFTSRSPCHPLLLRLNNITSPGCLRVKMALKLMPDNNPNTGTCEARVIYVGMGNTVHNIKGRWTTEKGTVTNLQAIVYRFAFDNQNKPMLLMKGDDNVLFLLDDEMNLVAGDADFSFTFNRSPKKS